MKLENRNNLPLVETVYDTHTLNQLMHRGRTCIIVPIKENPELKQTWLILRNKENGEFLQTQSRTVFGRGGEVNYTEKEWETVQVVSSYARSRRSHRGWGAYVLPYGLSTGQRVYIAELIEDIVATGYADNRYAAEDAEGVWDGLRIQIDLKPYSKFQIVG